MPTCMPNSQHTNKTYIYQHHTEPVQMTVYHQVLKTAYREVGRFFMPPEKCRSLAQAIAVM